jgi:hypothetical protein
MEVAECVPAGEGAVKIEQSYPPAGGVFFAQNALPLCEASEL